MARGPKMPLALHEPAMQCGAKDVHAAAGTLALWGSCRRLLCVENAGKGKHISALLGA